MVHSLRPVQRLPPELVRRIADQLVGIKEWVTISEDNSDTPPPETPDDAPPVRNMDYIGLRTMPSLATTSRFLLELTLDALWDTLPDYLRHSGLPPSQGCVGSGCCRWNG